MVQKQMHIRGGKKEVAGKLSLDKVDLTILYQTMYTQTYVIGAIEFKEVLSK